MPEKKSTPKVATSTPPQKPIELSLTVEGVYLKATGSPEFIRQTLDHAGALIARVLATPEGGDQ